MTLVKFKYIDLEDRANLIGLKFDPSYKNYIREKAEESIKNNVIYVSNLDDEALPLHYLNDKKENFKILFNKKIENLKSDFDRINYIRTILKDIKQAKQSYEELDIVYLPEMVNIYNEFDYKEIEQIDVMFEALYLINYLEEELKFYIDNLKLHSILKENKEEKAEEIENINEIKIPNEEIEYKIINGKILLTSIYTQQDLYSIIYMSYYNLEILNYYKEYKSITGNDDGLKNYFIFISDYILFKKKDSEIEEKVEWKILLTCKQKDLEKKLN